MISPEKEILVLDGGGEEERRRMKVNYDDEYVWLAGGMALFPCQIMSKEEAVLRCCCYG